MNDLLSYILINLAINKIALTCAVQVPTLLLPRDCLAAVTTGHDAF
ncbi:MAG: hypothetical protein ABIP74_00710 [Candidatus Saccharimonas sp.]